MKKAVRILAFAALLATFSLPAYAQDTAAGETAASAQDEEAKAKLYGEFVEKIKAKDAESQRRAAEIGKEYLSKFGTPATDADKQVVDYIRNWVAKYEKAAREFEFGQAVAQNPSRAFEIGRKWLTDEPDRIETRLGLVQAGIIANTKNNESLNAEMVAQARAALQAIEQGKAPAQWTAPWTNRDEAIALLNYAVGLGTYKNAPADAVPALIKVAQTNSTLKTDPTTYFYLGSAYYSGDFNRLAAEYKQQCEGKEASPECDALFARVNLALDHAIDAYARAAAHSKDQNQKAAFVKTLTALYKGRFQSVTNPDANVQTLVAGINALPLPLPDQPVTLPGAPAAEAATTETPAEAGTSPSTQPEGGSVRPVSSTPNGVKPAATAQPANPKPRS